MIFQLVQNSCRDKEQKLNFLSEQVRPELDNLGNGQCVGKQRHDPLHQVKVVVEADAFEVPEKRGDVERHQSCRQQGRILEVQIVCVFFNEWTQVGKVNLLEEWKDQALLARALELREQDDCDRV